jgi:ATP-dependent DNA ligase
MISEDDFSHRATLIQNYFMDGFVKGVDTQLIKSIEEIEHWHEVYTKQGYEGLMIRNASGKYKQDGRSQDLLKYKKFLDMEFPIVGADQNKGKLANTCTFRCTHNGAEFNVMPEGTQEEREQMYTDWKDGAIKAGDLLTVKFFSWTNSEKPVPRFPIGRFKYNT